MKRYKYIAFDLDGTLSDPSEGLLNGFVYAFRRLGIDYGERESLCRFIGPPLFEAWQREFGFSAEMADTAIELFREYYTVYGWRENRMYEGIDGLLDRLKSQDRILAVATSKPEEQARRIIKLFGLDKYFDYVGGAISHRERATKAEVLAYTLRMVGATDMSECVLVGDRCFDAEGARELGIDSVGVLYGHADEQELAAAGFTHIVENVEDVLKLLT